MKSTELPSDKIISVSSVFGFNLLGSSSLVKQRYKHLKGNNRRARAYYAQVV